MDALWMRGDGRYSSRHMQEIKGHCHSRPGQPGAGVNLPAARIRLLLHPRGRNGLRGTGHSHARARVDYGYGVAGPEGRRLMDLQLAARLSLGWLTGGWLEGGDRLVGRCERERGRDLGGWDGLVLERRGRRRAGCERGAVGGRGMDRLQLYGRGSALASDSPNTIDGCPG
jgi:hypothetical protein